MRTDELRHLRAMLASCEQEIGVIAREIPVFWKNGDNAERAEVAARRSGLVELHAKRAAIERRIALLQREEARDAPHKRVDC